MINVVIQGIGFVGSETAVAIASKTDLNNKPIFNVIGVDQSNKAGLKRIRSINKGNFPFISSDKLLLKLTKKCLSQKNLKATTSKKNYSKADVILVSINCDLIKTKGNWDIDLDKYCCEDINEFKLTKLFFENKYYRKKKL